MADKKYNISFTESELQSILNIIDVALRAQGLQLAGVAVGLTQKITAVVQHNQVENIEVPKGEIEL